MTNKNSTKRALLASVLAMLLCVTMLVGTTFAWFTDSVTSSGNIIKSGTLDVSLEYADTYDGANTAWNDASDNAIFNYEYWEPGFTQVKYIKVENEGSLAFRWQLNIIPNVSAVEGEVNLADVIDVYMLPVDVAVTRAALKDDTYHVGTLSELIADNDGAAYGIMLPAQGKGSDDVELPAGAEAITSVGAVECCIVLKMQESAGNEYQDLTVGDGFSVQLLAMQYTYENDSFDNMYDEDAGFLAPPVADVTQNGAKHVFTTIGMGGQVVEMDLNPTFTFKTTEDKDEAAAGPFAKYHADFVVKVDKDVAANSVALAGYYEAYCKDYNNNNWVALMSDETITAGTEIRLLQLLLNGGSMNYEELCQWVPQFDCGVADLSDGANAGTTLTVELRLYEVKDPADTANNTWNEETGNYITIGQYTHTFN